MHILRSASTMRNERLRRIGARYALIIHLLLLFQAGSNECFCSLVSESPHPVRKYRRLSLDYRSPSRKLAIRLRQDDCQWFPIGDDGFTSFADSEPEIFSAHGKSSGDVSMKGRSCEISLTQAAPQPHLRRWFRVLNVGSGRE